MNRSKVRIGRARAAVLAAMAALTLAGPALAARPTREVVDVGTTEIEGFISDHMSDVCEFEISVDADATITFMVFSSNDGSFRREIDTAQIKWTLTNVETGVSIDTHNVGPDIIWVTHDDVSMFASIGRAYVAHEGIGFIGRIVFNLETGESNFGGRLTGDIQQLVCAPLA